MIRMQSVYVTMNAKINHGMATAIFEQQTKHEFLFIKYVFNFAYVYGLLYEPIFLSIFFFSFFFLLVVVQILFQPFRIKSGHSSE